MYLVKNECSNRSANSIHLTDNEEDDENATVYKNKKSNAHVQSLGKSESSPNFYSSDMQKLKYSAYSPVKYENKNDKSPFKKLTSDLSPVRLMRAKILQPDRGFSKYFKIGLNYFILFVLITLVILTVIEASKYMHKYNKNRSTIISSIYTLNKNYKNLKQIFSIEQANDHTKSYETVEDVDQKDSFKKVIYYYNNLTNNTSNRNLASHFRHNQIEFQNQMNDIKNAINSIFLTINKPIEYCPYIPEGLEGPLNIPKILEKFNLTSLVDFHDNTTYNSTSHQYNKNYLYYLNKNFTLGNNSDPKDKLYWELWNTNNMNLLNTTANLHYGDGGARIQLGGMWKPPNCKSRFKLAIIIPFRDRLPHLKVITHFLHMILQRQLIDYRIFVVEPHISADDCFNKGRVMNSAFLEALKLDDFDCFIFHDVDLVPEDDRNMYTCNSASPKHLSVAIDKFQYVLPYGYLVGGVFAIRTNQYKAINGYSNSYCGWGGEDDDLSVRIQQGKLDIHRPPNQLARYKMMRHKLQKLNDNRHKQLRVAKLLQMKDGINSVSYRVLDMKLYTAFTYILVDVGTV